MNAFINNKEINIDILGYNYGLNFNRFFDDTEIAMYSLQVSKKYFIDKLLSVYNDARDEIKVDDELYNETSDFTEVNYCSLIELINHPKHLLEIFDTYLRADFFRDFTNSNSVFMINSIDLIEVSEKITIHGKSYVLKNKTK